MKHSQTKAPLGITCNSQETSDTFGTKHNKNNSAVFAKRQYYFLSERMKLILPNSRNNLRRYEKDSRKIYDRCPRSFRYFY